MGADGNRNFDVSFGGKLTKYRVTISNKLQILTNSILAMKH